MSEDYKFENMTEAGEKIRTSGTSTLPQHVKQSLSNLETYNNKPKFVRKILTFTFKTRGVNRNPYVANRATRMLLFTTYFLWVLTFMFLIGSAVNFFLLEKVELSATSHDARIESTGTPIRVRGLE